MYSLGFPFPTMNLPWEIELSLDTKGKQKGAKYSKSPNHVRTTNQTLIYGQLTWKYYIGMYVFQSYGGRGGLSFYVGGKGS